MLSRYFGLAEYNRQGQIVSIPDLTKHVAIPSEYKNNQKYWIVHDLKDSDTLSQLSKTIYGSHHYWWVIVLLNDMVNIDSSWPIPEYNFREWFKKQFPENEYGDILHWVDGKGNVHDPEAYVILGECATVNEAIVKYQLSSVSFYNYYYKENENKRRIKLLLPEYVSTLNKQLEEIFR